MQEYELKAIYDRCKSFYKKAFVIVDSEGNMTLRSYSTNVLELDNKGNVHIRGFYAGSKQELEKLYC